MADNVKDIIVAAVTEMRQFFSQGTDNDKFNVYANKDGELFIFLPYKEFMELIKKTKKQSEIA